jgi:hypothetical protein
MENAVLEAVASNGLAINGQELGGRKRGEVKRRAVTWWLAPVEAVAESSQQELVAEIERACR